MIQTFCMARKGVLVFSILDTILTNVCQSSVQTHTTIKNATFSRFEGGSMIVQGHLGLVNTILRINDVRMM